MSGHQWELSSKPKSRTVWSGTKRFCPLFYWLLVQQHCQACTWLGQEQRAGGILQGHLMSHLVSHLPATTSCSLPSGRASRVWTHPPPTSTLKEVASPKGELLIAHTPLCSEIGSSLSAKVLLLALAETWPPFALFPYCLVPLICLPLLSHIFPSLTLKMYNLLISLSLSFAMM